MTQNNIIIKCTKYKKDYSYDNIQVGIEILYTKEWRIYLQI